MCDSCFKRVSDYEIPPTYRNIHEIYLLHGLKDKFLCLEDLRRQFDHQVFSNYYSLPLTSLLTFSLYPFCFCRIQQICRNRLSTSYAGTVTADCFRGAWATCHYQSLSSQSWCLPCVLGAWQSLLASPRHACGCSGTRLKGD